MVSHGFIWLNEAKQWLPRHIKIHVSDKNSSQRKQRSLIAKLYFNFIHTVANSIIIGVNIIHFLSLMFLLFYKQNKKLILLILYLLKLLNSPVPSLHLKLISITSILFNCWFICCLFLVYSTPGHGKIWFKAVYNLETILSCGWKDEEVRTLLEVVGGN